MTPRALGLVIPFHDDVQGCTRDVRGLVAALRAAAIPHRLVLVDNGSRDGTGSRLEALARTEPAIEVLHLPENAGYGGGILAGLRRLDTPFQGWHWGDGQVRPDVVVAAWTLLQRGGYDLVKALRVQRRDGLERAAVSRIYNAATRTLLRIPSADVNGCPKLFRREALQALRPASQDWLLDLEVMDGIRRQGLRWAEVPATMWPRAAGTSHVRPATLLEFAGAMARAAAGRPPWGQSSRATTASPSTTSRTARTSGSE